MKEQNKNAEVLITYFKQDTKDAKTMYDDEIRAEADLCSECCACCRVCCIVTG